jgi:glycosyltransferase involved in cell wall biosynthesis
MSNKSILLVIDSLGIGGAEKVVLTLSTGFYTKGYSIDIIICDDIISFPIPDYINIYKLHFKKSTFAYRKYSQKLHHLVDTLSHQHENGYELILVNLQKSTRLMNKYQHKSIFHIIHSNFSQSALKKDKAIKNFFRKKKLQNIYNGLNLIAVSKGIEEDLINTIHLRPNTIQTIYNPIDNELISKLSEEKLTIQEDEYIIHVGRFAKVKRHDILLKAFAKIQYPNLKLLLIGDGEEKENIQNLIKQLNLSERVVLTGFLHNPYPLIKNAKLLVLSSEYEGFGNTLVESLVLNTPVISTNCKSGPNEILTGSLKEYLVEVNNVIELYKKIENILLNQYEIIDKAITKKFLLETIIEQYISLIGNTNA